MAFTHLPIEEVFPNPHNPRITTEEQFQALKQSILSSKGKEHFEARPCIISKRTGKNIIIAGNTRYQAAKILKEETVPCYIMEGLTEEEEQRIIIEDNLSRGRWNWDILANEWDTEQLAEWGMDLPEFEQLPTEEVEEDNPNLEPPKEPITKRGDIYELGEHRVMCGDSTMIDDVEKLMNGEKADIVFTDPPYGYSYESNYQKEHKELLNDDKQLDFIPCAYSATKDNAGFYICGSFQTIADWIKYTQEYLDYKNLIVWKKNNWSMGDLKGAYAGQHELIIYASKGRIELLGGRDQDVWEFDRVPPSLHPTMKPVRLIAKAIQKHNGGVLDLFLGSGSTLIACEKTDRKCYGMELDEKYCDVIVRRYIKHCKDNNKEPVVKLNGALLDNLEQYE